ncbi:MAG TPA: hypothetical protein VGL98_19145 [Gammaproteobacteria bacterium]
MSVHRCTSVIAIELKPGQGALPLPPPRVAGVLLAGWLLVGAIGVTLS